MALTKTEYNKVHVWIKKQKGKANRCESCKTDKLYTRFDWSNISDQYKYELSDWQMLCRVCHSEFDRERSHAKQEVTLLKRYGTRDIWQALDIIAAKKYIVRYRLEQFFMTKPTTNTDKPIKHTCMYMMNRGWNGYTCSTCSNIKRVIK
jgi:hypothetical protein